MVKGRKVIVIVDGDVYKMHKEPLELIEQLEKRLEEFVEQSNANYDEITTLRETVEKLRDTVEKMSKKED